MTDTQTTRWDEPSEALSPRGWLHLGGVCVGFYLDYGPEHYRSPHEYCSPRNPCPTCEPGSVLAVRYPNGPGTTPHEWRWTEQVTDARRFVETGAPARMTTKG